MDNNCITCISIQIYKTINDIPYCKICLEQETQAYIHYEQNRKNFYPEMNHIIADKLYLGNYDQAREIDSLIQNNITHILICGRYMSQLHQDKFFYEQFEIEDTIEEDISKYFKKAIDFIDNSDVVFVHCHAGISRSASIVIAYVMYKYKLRYEEAHNYVKKRRGIIYPNESFIKQLKEFEKDLFGMN